MFIDSPDTDAAEDSLKAHMSDEDQILQGIEHLGCPKFFEPSVVHIFHFLPRSDWGSGMHRTESSICGCRKARRKRVS